MNNSVASSTSDVISFHVREENERNREGGRGRQARLGIIRCSRRTKLLVAVSFTVRNRRLAFTVRHHYAILEAILMSTVTFEIRRWTEPRWHTLNATRTRECIIYECIKENYTEELRALISRSPLSPNAFRKLCCQVEDDVRRKEPLQKMQSAFIANRIRRTDKRIFLEYHCLRQKFMLMLQTQAFNSRFDSYNMIFFISLNYFLHFYN